MSIGNIRIIYCSTVTSALEKDNFIDLVRRSVTNNKELNLTGILLFDGQYFFQVLEGDQKDVKTILAKISQDERHKDIHTLSKIG
ncbi:MAG: BLUF domain-containing protein, partial [Marinobacterium sp.]|nr:BLUF domain-containing protein [Marinobacterium sp.]